MNLKNLKIMSTNAKSILIAINNFNMSMACNFHSYKEQYKELLFTIEQFSKHNNIEVSYFQAAKKPLWQKIAIPEESIIIKGFTGSVYANTRSDKFDDVEIKIKLDNGMDLSTDEVLSMCDKNKLQYDLINDIIQLQEKRLLEALKRMWTYEKERINIWLKSCKIKVPYLT